LLLLLFFDFFTLGGLEWEVDISVGDRRRRGEKEWEGLLRVGGERKEGRGSFEVESDFLFFFPRLAKERREEGRAGGRAPPSTSHLLYNLSLSRPPSREHDLLRLPRTRAKLKFFLGGSLQFSLPRSISTSLPPPLLLSFPSSAQPWFVPYLSSLPSPRRLTFPPLSVGR